MTTLQHPPTSSESSTLAIKWVIKLPEVQQLTTLSSSSIYEMMARGEFPQNFKLGKKSRSVGWDYKEVCEWIEQQKAEAANEAHQQQGAA